MSKRNSAKKARACWKSPGLDARSTLGAQHQTPRTLVNASVPLERLVSGLQRRSEGSVCMYGPLGTGKTAFARELARRLQRPFARRSAGDLLDKYVAGTERAIAEMFEEAARSGSVLLLD